MCTFLQESTAAAAELMQPDLCRMASILMTILRTSLPSPAMDNENGETSHEAICEAELTRCLAEGIDEEKIRDIPNRCADASKWRHQGCTVSFDELKACLEAWHPARIENLNAFVSNLPDCADLDRWLAVDNAIPERDVDIPVPDPCHSIVTTCPEMAAHIGLKK